MVNYIIVFFTCILATLIGAICGVGGGIVIKPVLDSLAIMSVAAGSFLSGCTVLAMTVYSVVRSKVSGKSKLNMRTSTALAIGAVIGGITGKYIFQYIWTAFSIKDKVGLIQALTLIVVTVGTLLYMLNKEKIKTLDIHNIALTVLTGFALGMISSFLGIGGGPINLVVLYYFFSMETKTATENSLYIILFSQAASLVTYFISNTIPDVSVGILALMIGAGIAGAITGRKINKKISSASVDKLFTGFIALVIVINVFNALKFAGFINI